MVYDDACHLKPHCDARVKEGKSDRVKIFSQISFVVDKLHIKGHVGDICKNTVHPDLFPELDESNTVVCEQINFTVGRHKHPIKHMNRDRFHFFLYILFDMLNEVKITRKFSTCSNWEYAKSHKRKFDVMNA